MNDYKWNHIAESYRYWDHESESVKVSNPVSDKQLINQPNLAKFEDILRALCHVVSELVEIEESKSNER